VARRMGVGLYLDLAVSVSRDGADAQANPAIYAERASVGAPPDDFSPHGQDWGLPPTRPSGLREEGYATLRRALVASMREAGAVRIDHVMGLMRLFWVPGGATPADGAYVHYALGEQLAVLVLESHRNRCAVIGESLGNVPDAVRNALREIGALSYRVMFFEREWDGAFRAPACYERDAAVCASTHDLPTFAGWWSGRDIEWREALGLVDAAQSPAQRRAERAADRARLAAALVAAGFPCDEGPENPPLESAHAFLAASPSRVLMVQIEDALGLREQANVPGTTVEHPNWRRRLPLDLASIAADPRVLSLASRLRQLRSGEGRSPRSR